ncbi:MAG: transporter substrate-binding domain-containing protein [Parachlamydiales bacterium]|jgi:arginine transport system substrate-binding protein
MFKSFAYILACLTCVFSGLQAENLVVGTTTAYAPFVSLDEKGEMVGFDIDIAKALAAKLNRRLVFKDLGSMPSLMLSLKQGKVDLLIWAISITEERQKQMEMVFYQGETITTMPLIFWNKIPDGVSSIQDLANDPKNIVCVEAGSFQESFAQNVKGLRLKQVDKVLDAMMEIRYGKSTAILVDSSLVATLQKQFPQMKVMEIPLPQSEQSLGNGICIQKKNPQLAVQVRAAIDELRREGVIAELEKKWNLEGK